MNDKHEPNIMVDEQDIHAYVDGRLGAAGRRRVEAWLQRHPERAEDIHRWRQDAQQLRATHAALPGLADAPDLDPAVVRKRRKRRMRAGLATAAVLLLTLSVGLFGGWRTSDRAQSALPMADALQAYRMLTSSDGAALDVSQHNVGSLQTWLDQHVRLAATLPDLNDAGYHVVGARLIATATGAAAMVLYRSPDGGTIGFYVRPPSRRKGRLRQGQRRDGRLVVAYGSGKDYNYALVSHAGAAAIRALREIS